MNTNLLPFSRLLPSKRKSLTKRRVVHPVYQVESLEERALLTAFTVAGKALWTDGAGGTHQVPLAVVEVYDQEGPGARLIGTTTTNLLGNYSARFDFTDSTGGPDVFVKLLARSTVADVKPSAAGSATYFIDSTVSNDVAEGATITKDITAGNTTDTGKAFSVHHSLVMISQYTGNLTGRIPSLVDVRYDATITGSFFRTSPTKQLFIRGTAWNQWDVIHHEYGHFVQNQYQFEANPGGAHSSSANLSSTRGSKAIGLPLAWGEGWPTYFAIAGQNMMGAAALGIPQVGDSLYQSTNGGTISFSLETGVGVGEDNELSVMATLWDLWDNTADGLDRSTISDKALFENFKASKPTTIGAAWESLAATRDNAGKAELATVFAQNNIAPNLQGPADGASIGGTPPTFTWLKNGGGTPNPLNDFRIKFYSSDFSNTLFTKELGDVATFTPTAAEWTSITSGNPIVKWVIEGRNTTAPASPGGSLGYYWSQARTLGSASIVFVIDDTGSMSEEISGVVAALQSYIDLVELTLPPGTTPPSIQVLTFKDDVTSRIISSDLNAVRTVVSNLFASGGGDCPEFSAQALAVAADSVGAGGTILLATDASTQPGVDMAAVIAKLRSKGVTVSTILSGDCGDIGSVPAVETSTPPVEDDDGCDCDCDGTDGDCHCNGSSVTYVGSPTVPPAFTTTVASTSGSGILHEPGFDGSDDDDLPQPFVDDPGQDPIDDYGNTTAEAAVLTIGASPMLGTVGGTGDPADVFSATLKADFSYQITVAPIDSAYFTLNVIDIDGETVLQNLFPGSGFETVSFVPETDGVYFFELTTFYTGPAYLISMSEAAGSALASTSAVDLFSTVSALTGGTFLVREGVNSGDPESYEAALFNVMASSLGARVLSATPDSVPAGQTIAVGLIASSTNWRNGETTVSFSDPKIVVKSVTVTSATTLTALVEIDPTLTPDLYDATVSTPLGGGTEVAVGTNVLVVTEPVTEPTLLSADPSTLEQGSTGTLTLRGANLTWTAASVVNLGSGITVNSVVVESPTQLKVNYTVQASAAIGFRTPQVTTGDIGTVSKGNAIFVSAAGVDIPEIVGLSDDDGAPGSNITVTVTGANTHFVNGVTTASFGDGITVLSVNVTSDTTATVNLAIAANASAGFRNVSLSTGAESAVLLQGFFVGEGSGASVGGDVTAVATKGAITITGDDLSNHISVTISGKKSITITGLNGTTINGETGPVTLSAKSLAMINMGAGDDQVTIISTSSKGIKKSAAVDMGEGNDTLRLEGLKIKGRARLTLGAGADRLQVVSSSFSKQTTTDVNPVEDILEELSSAETRARKNWLGRFTARLRGLFQ